MFSPFTGEKTEGDLPKAGVEEPGEGACPGCHTNPTAWGLTQQKVLFSQLQSPKVWGQGAGQVELEDGRLLWVSGGLYPVPVSRSLVRTPTHRTLFYLNRISKYGHALGSWNLSI